MNIKAKPQKFCLVIEHCVFVDFSLSDTKKLIETNVKLLFLWRFWLDIIVTCFVDAAISRRNPYESATCIVTLC